MTDCKPANNKLTTAWFELRSDLIQIGLTQKWPETLGWIGFAHLIASLSCHICYKYVTIDPLPYLFIWSTQLTTNLWIIRKLIGRGWTKSSPLIGILARIWATFLIISFSATSYSEISADQANHFNWFKPVWASLSCFAWAVTAWIVNPWFVLAAVWTWAMGWAMIFWIEEAYLIYGIGWALLLWIISAILMRKRHKTVPENPE